MRSVRLYPLRIWLVSLLIALPAGVWLLFPNVIRCVFVGQSSDFVGIPDSAGTLYISQDTPQRQAFRLIDQNRQAVARIRSFWGDRQGRAALIYCHTPQQYIDYCGSGEGAGCSLGTPWGQSFLVLGSAGNTADVIAHERCHDELFARVGWWRTKRQIPQWFNEGLALLVDYRFTTPTADVRQRHRDLQDEWRIRSGGGQTALTLADIETTRGFFGGDYQYVMLAYLTAAAEVSGWLVRAGPTGPAQLTTRVGAGEEFAEIYGDQRPGN